MCIVQSLKTDADQVSHTFQLHVFAYTGINLRDSVSLFSRVIISSEQTQDLCEVCSNFFRRMGVMKLFTKRLRVFIYPKDVALPSFAIVGYPKMPLLGNVTFVQINCKGLYLTV